MKPLLIAVVLAALMIRPASADDAAVAANQLLAAQIADAVTTRVMIQQSNTFERDPLARPFVHSNLAEAGAVVATSLLVRVLFRHAPTVMRLLTVVEAACVVNNVRVISR